MQVIQLVKIYQDVNYLLETSFKASFKSILKIKIKKCLKPSGDRLTDIQTEIKPVQW